MLSNNLITHVESLYFVPMMVLKTLDSYKHLITKIEFKNTIWPSISFNIMDDNHLTLINIADLRVWGNVLITGQGNPWHCGMELCWLPRCQYNMGKRKPFWSKCPGSWMIRLCDLICNSPKERKNIAIKKSGKNSYW